MIVCRHIKNNLLVSLLLVATPSVSVGKDYGSEKVYPESAKAEKLGTEHLDPIQVDSTLSLQQLVDLTLEKYPDRFISEALVQEAEALQVRGDSWFAGSNALYLDYSDDQITNNHGYNQSSVKLEFTPWFWGQRSAAENIATQAHFSAQKQSAAVKLEVARLVREALWGISLAEIRLQQAKFTLDISAQLLEKVQKRVELGDLARADLLLAQSEHLQNRTQLILAEAEMMHNRKNYAALTQTTHIPANFQEQLSSIETIEQNHPLIEAVNSLIARKQATIEWAKPPIPLISPRSTLDSKHA